MNMTIYKYSVFRLVVHFFNILVDFFNFVVEKWLYLKVIVWGGIKSEFDEITINHVKGHINPMHSLLSEKIRLFDHYTPLLCKATFPW